MDFSQSSYEAHEKHGQEYLQDEEKRKITQTWYEKNTTDYWRHQRMYDCLLPILETYRGAKWLTVGDGRCGTDANYIIENGSQALATDLVVDLLEEAKKIGFIADYKKENVEALSFADDEFDFTLCKESYHHFPRPALGLYEMLRVSKRGIILIEPSDAFSFSKISDLSKILFLLSKTILKFAISGKKINRNSYEPVGNYISRISEREIEKISLALNFPAIAFKGQNDFYLPGVETEICQKNAPLFKKIKRKILFFDLLSKINLQNYGLLTAIIFKEQPSPECVQKLKQQGFHVIMLEKNPYIKE
jgi:ubiquinone/menaquinone biosynthesis C-methylase UbiE